MRAKTVLFLCTGNYYRSRFAELLFNDLAPKQGLDWIAISRGLALERGVNNVGPISRHAVAGLLARKIELEDKPRFPMSLGAADLGAGNHVVAIDRDEHLPLVQDKFPQWIERVEFWDVHDLEYTRPQEALDAIERNVIRLIGRLTG